MEIKKAEHKFKIRDKVIVKWTGSSYHNKIGRIIKIKDYDHYSISGTYSSYKKYRKISSMTLYSFFRKRNCKCLSY